MAGTRAKPDLRTVTIAIVGDGAAADRMQAKLKAAGIESIVTSERSYTVKKPPDGAVQHQPWATRPAASGPRNREAGAVKVQVAHSDVQRALGILGAGHRAVTPVSEVRIPERRTTDVRPRPLKERDPTVPTIVVAFIILAALILFLT
jgi:hypothetical protein